MDKIKYLNDIILDTHLKAALVHKSAGRGLLDALSSTNQDVSLPEIWETYGQGIITFYSARLALNYKGIKSPASCSLMSNSIKKELTNQLNKIIKASGMVIFGHGVSEKEKTELKTYTSISNKLIGAYAHKHTIDDSIKNLLKPLLDTTKLNVSTEKDSKTFLQEYLQEKYKEKPTYKVVSVSGLQHDQTFEVEFYHNGEVTTGKGKSKKNAEKDAADSFIRNNKIYKYSTQPIDLSIFIDFKKSLTKTHNNYNNYNLKRFCENNRISFNKMNLLTLATKHKSSSIIMDNSNLGRDNTLLAFIGSNVLNLLAQKIIINTSPQVEKKTSGGIQDLVAKLISSPSISNYYHSLSVDTISLLGPGEKSPHENLKAEFIQAICGAIYLYDESTIDSCLSSGSLPIVEKQLKEQIEINNEINNDLLFSKRLLQEKCQSLGCRIIFETKKNINNDKVTFHPSIIIKSEETARELVIGKSYSYDNDQTQPKIARVESELAREINIFFNIIFSNNTDYIKRISPTFENLDSWIWHDVKNTLYNSKESKNFIQRNKLKKSNFLGLFFLRERLFTQFEKWLSNLNEIFNIRNDSYFINALGDFYEASSHTTENIHTNYRIKENLLSLEDELKKADPLDVSLKFLEIKPFTRLVSTATSLKMKSGEIVKNSISNIIYEFNLLNKKNKNEIILKGDNFDILEIQGTHLTLLNQLVNASSDNIVIIYKSDNFVTFEIKDISGAYNKSHKENPISLTLHDLLPIVKIKKNEEQTIIYTGSLHTNKDHENCLNLWWKFINQGKTVMDINGLIASMLHSIKNDILGFTYSSSHAIKEESLRKKYQLAAEAGTHTDQALARLRIVRGILKDINPLQMEPIRLDLLIKSLVTNIWSWVPNTVVISFPPNNSQSIIWTSKDNLNSIIINLVRNSVEAMCNIGEIDISHTLNAESSSISFIVSDSGPGFTEMDLNKLNSGVSVESSKKKGQGIGLLTVILLVKELSGTIRFTNKESGGGVVELSFPSLPNDILEDKVYD